MEEERSGYRVKKNYNYVLENTYAYSKQGEHKEKERREAFFGLESSAKFCIWEIMQRYHAANKRSSRPETLKRSDGVASFGVQASPGAVDYFAMRLQQQNVYFVPHRPMSFRNIWPPPGKATLSPKVIVPAAEWKVVRHKQFERSRCNLR